MTSPLSLPTTTTYTISLHDALPILVDDGVAADAAEEIRRRYPSAKLTRAAAANYFANKNAGAAAASGEIIALVDADCVDRKSTRLNSSHQIISYAVFCVKKKKCCSL